MVADTGMFNLLAETDTPMFTLAAKFALVMEKRLSSQYTLIDSEDSIW